MHNLDNLKNALPSLLGELSQIEPIGQGGMAQIFKARQEVLNRWIAIKCLKPELLQSAETKERFRREAKALASVLHQNIAHVYGFHESSQEAFIFMEYIEGVDLSVAIQKVGAIPFEIACSILYSICQGVSYIHRHRLIHRDIKPSNIRLTPQGEVKLMDFGIVMNTENLALTRPGMMVGSPCYLSPEQVLGDPLTYQSDIFLLGICLYEMTTGTRPFNDEGARTVFQKIRDCDYIPPEDMNTAIPSRVARIIGKCLERDPKERYLTTQDLMLDLEKALKGKLANRSDLILQFCDEEALLTPSTPYGASKDNSLGWSPLSSTFANFETKKAWLLAILLFGLGAVAGYLLSEAYPQWKSLPSSSKPIR